MSLKAIVSEELESALKTLKKKDRAMYNAVEKKMIQIVSGGMESIRHFKNLKGGLSDFKRVHIGHFVLKFRVEQENVIFESFEHHDDAYEK
ncbi:MAG: addiction module toxin RelE [Candidatus Nanoarchaeia archaeon]|nr:addiction module toxin RelE [Candidatus Nanoarchaeia archaeon]